MHGSTIPSRVRRQSPRGAGALLGPMGPGRLAAGLECEGICASRPDDAAGVFCSYVAFSSDAGFAEDGETVLELFYRIARTPWASIKPDIQYIFDPSGDPAVDDAIVATLRVTVAF